MKVAVFAMSDANHYRRVHAVVEALTAAGADVRVYSDRAFAPQARAAGATLVDVFTPFPLDRADPTSRPLPVRHVTWAGVFAEEILELVRAFGPDLVVYNTFAPIGHVVGATLELPYVGVLSGHNMVPERVLAKLAQGTFLPARRRHASPPSSACASATAGSARRRRATTLAQPAPQPVLPASRLPDPR